MQLVIAEKPSVARDLARVLGVRGSGRHSLGDSRRIITWCIGHLVELDEPAAYDGRWKAWRLDALPMIPTTFKIRPVESTRDQLRAVRELLADRRFSEVVNACDAGREGELIFRYVYDIAGSRLPVRRLWISSMTDEAIARGFAALKAGADYDALGDAARCRSEADWLVGMNATRAVTITKRDHAPAPRAGAARGGQRAAGLSRSPVYSIGRVQTPTLAIVVRREQAILAFRAQDYWEVRGTFSIAGPAEMSFNAGWGLRTVGSQADAEGGSTPTVNRLGTQALASEIVARASTHGAAADANGPVVESLRQKKSREPAPQLFDLTSLQRTANRRFGLSATRTLEAAQALYERHKLLTYPRTDARHLSNDLFGELPKLFSGLTQLPEYAPFARTLLAAPPTRSKRVFDDAKVHDHHAIIPTGKTTRLETLHADERRVFDLVVRRFLGVFYPDAEFALTDVVIRAGATVAAAPPVGGATPTPTHQADGAPVAETLIATLPPPPDRFFARGRVRLVAGWQEVANFGPPGVGATGASKRAAGPRDKEPEPDGDPTSTLPPLTEGQRLDGKFDSLAKQTKPPPRHTEATLLGAMEYAGRDIEDEELRAAMRDTGLGTPATRAATIETLVRRGFIAREGKQIVASSMGIALVDGLPVASLASPELTGSWEARLARVARGQETRAAFMGDIARYVGEVVEAIRRAPRGPGATAAASAPNHQAATPKTATNRPAARPTTATNRRRPPTAPAARPRATPPATAATALICPRCKHGPLVAGKRGWGCSRWREGCSFVVWFETAGKRLTAAQLRDLVVKGKTRKADWTPSGGPPTPGRLVLDLAGSPEAGGARFLASSGAEEPRQVSSVRRETPLPSARR
jgi:DNA topoisomerase III